MKEKDEYIRVKRSELEEILKEVREIKERLSEIKGQKGETQDR